MNLFEAYQTSNGLESQGVWIPFEHANCKVKLARMSGNNKEWDAAKDDALRPVRKRYRDRAIPDVVFMAAIREPFARLIIKDWENVTGPDGFGLPCNMENKVMVLTKLPDFFRELVDEAGEAAYFRGDDEEVDAKKS